MSIIAYRNGNCKVIIKPDGTKIREGNSPELPESIDLKITGYCDAGCSWCHESSTKLGRHADPYFICSLINEMIPGTELAIGGGNPLTHPKLSAILKYANARMVYASLTVNHKHLEKTPVNLLQAGLGVSVPLNGVFSRWLKNNYSDRIVFHVILGLHKPSILEKIRSQFPDPKILLLGYKNFGFGTRIHPRLHEWQSIDFSGALFAFDNLAVEQLALRQKIPKEVFDKHYMGNDGSHTMYIDAVAQQFAISSISKRLSCKHLSLREMFQRIRT